MEGNFVSSSPLLANNAGARHDLVRIQDLKNQSLMFLVKVQVN